MTRSNPTKAQVVIAAGGLGTRVHHWARYLPKDFLPVDGRPGIVHVLEEITALGPAHVVIVYHPYYTAFAAWARQALTPNGRSRYLRAVGRALDDAPDRTRDLAVDFVAQHGPYGDLTSVINGADHLACSAARGDLYVAFSDNLYPDTNPTLALHDVPAGQVAVVCRPYRPDLAAHHGVIATAPGGHHRHVIELIEKPCPVTAHALERRYGTANLMLLEGRARVTADFVDFTRAPRRTPPTEPKLALAIATYARTHPILAVQTSSHLIDLGAPAHQPATAATRSRSA